MESTIYVVRDCDFAQIVQKSLVPRLKWNAFFNLHVGYTEISRMRELGEWPTFFSIVTWFLWKSHNDFIFNNTSRSSHKLIASTLVWVKSFGFSGNIEQLVCFSKTEQGWQRLKPRWIKINVDESVSMSNTKAAIGGAVRDSSEVWSVGFKMVTVVSNVFQIEARAVVEGLKLVWLRGFK
ncbi:hypothetical protein PVK06_049615 [Gossypium arboreum]|uniref:RNase H type-1 domain-containing protein n=1 Tax=Gossypium arboreum TaxID=29729 RepID=A0ABR0MJ57_GOSAR|nr:hypothetical protein PVK06_049615 [Gossypium arboreum]